jgi:hypothetical protein
MTMRFSTDRSGLERCKGVFEPDLASDIALGLDRGPQAILSILGVIAPAQGGG